MVKFLVIRFSSIGDIVLTSPVVRCLKQQVEEAEVHFLTKPAFSPLVQHNPYIDKVLTLKPKLSDTIQEIKNESYDYIIDLHHNIRTTIIKNRTQILSFSFPKLNWKKWLLVNFKVNLLPKVHVVDRYFETVKLFDVYNDKKGLELFIPDEEQIDVKSLSNFLHNGYWAIVVGAKHETKKIPTWLIVELINEIKQPVILLGDQNDVAHANAIVSSTSFKEIYNACGKYTILQSASIIKQARVVLTADTGLMHIAAALGKKIVSVWGNTVPEFGMFPYLSEEFYYINEVKNLACRPCSKLGFKQCPKKHFDCMNKQDVNAIATQIKQFLENKV